MKIKSRLRCFSSLEEDVEDGTGSQDAFPRHLPMTYEGVCDAESIKGDRYCVERAS